MSGHDDYDPGYFDLPGPAEALELEVHTARRALDRLTAALAAGGIGDERTTGKAAWHRRQLAQFIGQATASVEVIRRHPGAEADLATDLADMAHDLAEDAETAEGWAHYLTATAEARRTAAARKWAAALDAKTAKTAKHLEHAGRTLARALALDTCHSPAMAPRPRHDTARRGRVRCQLARMVTTTGDDPLPARPQRCPNRGSVATAGLLTKGQGTPTG
jgi:hypothetical protein